MREKVCVCVKCTYWRSGSAYWGNSYTTVILGIHYSSEYLVIASRSLEGELVYLLLSSRSCTYKVPNRRYSILLLTERCLLFYRLLCYVCICAAVS